MFYMTRQDQNAMLDQILEIRNLPTTNEGTNTVVCDTCGKSFTTKIKDLKVLLNKAYCSDHCFYFNNGSYE